MMHEELLVAAAEAGRMPPEEGILDTFSIPLTRKELARRVRTIKNDRVLLIGLFTPSIVAFPLFLWLAASGAWTALTVSLTVLGLMALLLISMY
jgi:VIT1/CCC1 family predicted Fe2+/Mn2+ transporter